MRMLNPFEACALGPCAYQLHSATKPSLTPTTTASTHRHLISRAIAQISIVVGPELLSTCHTTWKVVVSTSLADIGLIQLAP